MSLITSHQPLIKMWRFLIGSVRAHSNALTHLHTHTETQFPPNWSQNHPSVWSSSVACQPCIAQYHQWVQLSLVIIMFHVRGQAEHLIQSSPCVSMCGNQCHWLRIGCRATYMVSDEMLANWTPEQLGTGHTHTVDSLDWPCVDCCFYFRLLWMFFNELNQKMVNQLD